MSLLRDLMFGHDFHSRTYLLCNRLGLKGVRWKVIMARRRWCGRSGHDVPEWTHHKLCSGGSCTASTFGFCDTCGEMVKVADE